MSSFSTCNWSLNLQNISFFSLEVQPLPPLAIASQPTYRAGVLFCVDTRVSPVAVVVAVASGVAHSPLFIIYLRPIKFSFHKHYNVELGVASGHSLSLTLIAIIFTQMFAHRELIAVLFLNRTVI